MAELYAFHELSRRFGDREVLHIPRLSLEAGGICALTGPNGAGKTTLMRIMAFLDAPTTGDVFFRGENITPEKRAGLRGRAVWVSQFPVLFSGTLLYNVAYPMRLKGAARAQAKERARELLELVGLIHLAEAPARRLSGGESQRACVARALAAGAEVLLFDEPTANVDRHARDDLMRIIRELWEREKLSVFITTHDADLVASLCQERLALFDGRLARQGLVPADTAMPADLARPARLWRSGQGLAIAGQGVDKGSRNTGEEREGTVVGLASGADGVIVRIRFDNGGSTGFLLNDAKEKEAARTLVLESRIRVIE